MGISIEYRYRSPGQEALPLEFVRPFVVQELKPGDSVSLAQVHPSGREYTKTISLLETPRNELSIKSEIETENEGQISQFPTDSRYVVGESGILSELDPDGPETRSAPVFAPVVDAKTGQEARIVFTANVPQVAQA